MGRGDAHSVCSVDKSKGKTDHDRGFAGSFIMRSGKDGVITAGAKSYFDWIIPALWSEEEEAAIQKMRLSEFFSIQKMEHSRRS